MIDISKIDTGDIGVKVVPETLINRIIGIFTNNKSHSFTFIWEHGKLYVYEMVKYGPKREFYEKEYGKKDTWVLMKPVNPFTDGEKMKIIYMANYLYFNCVGYDVFSLLKHAYKKFFNRFRLEKKDDKKYICSELSTMIFNYARPHSFPYPETQTPEDIYNSKLLKKSL